MAWYNNVKRIEEEELGKYPATTISVSECAKIDAIAAMVMDNGANAAVMNADQQLVGILTRQAVINVLVSRDQT